MYRVAPALISTLLFPTLAFAATASPSPSTFIAENSVLIASSSEGGVYAAGGTVTVTASTKGDLSALAGSVIVAGATSGDALLGGGSVSLRAPVAGDARIMGGSVSVEAPVAGDLVIFAPSVSVSAAAGGSILLVGANVTVSRGAKGGVTIYGNNVALDGDFVGDVRVVAGGRVSLGDATKIAGSFWYESPEQARISTSAVIDGGVHYTGPSYLPSSEQAHALVLAGFGVFLFIRFLAAIILAGLVAGLFPRFVRNVANDAFETSIRHRLLAVLLGFAIIVATPMLIFLLALTFVGLGIAIFAAALYVLLTIISFVLAGVLVGNFLARMILKRKAVRWHDGVIGMLVFSLLALIPGLGIVLNSFLVFFAEGTIAVLLFHAIFPRDSQAALVE